MLSLIAIQALNYVPINSFELSADKDSHIAQRRPFLGLNIAAGCVLQ